ncbi:efflux RND transporter permease subunit [Rhodopirellula sp. MGV]|uniref:efflux RND transporter permease subunit n=1 Tax=Rhodopirellula sp. MGV TaxID=2023130 RepID=UPI000B961AC9|nr:efflux RND transporter permease subunit [Rhodopirellula sp. MGV]OYP32269.1 hypothetical protein CGZ80_19560 [Rhodopirellula sp. MGV]PNY35948.1 AcrB/AcrD/AcrF family protein [Rhodopirellula baltica]
MIGREDTFDSMATLFYRKPRILTLVVGLVIVAGLTSLSVLPRMEDPLIGQRAGLVSTRMLGADAKRIEALVTEPLEDRLQKVEEIKKLTSESRPGISTIQIELREDVMETDEVWSDVRAKISDVIPALPDEALRPVFDEIEVRAYALIVNVCWDSNEEPSWGVLRRLAKQLEDELQAIGGTEVVERFADPGEQITVELDPNAIADLRLGASEIAQAIGQFDAKNAAGLMRSGSQNVVLEMANQFDDVSRIAEAVIRVGTDGEVIRLADVATLHRGAADPLPRMAIVDGRPAVSLGAMVRRGERLDRWRPKAQQAIERFRESLPSGVLVAISLDQSRYVDSRLSTLAVNLIIGAAAVMAVVFLLMGWRSAVVVAAALPLSMLTVLFGLRVLGIPIHQMSVTGLIIALGLLIDNAIVAVDEVNRLIREGHRRIDAVRHTVGQLTVPLVGSTITTALAFAPIAIMPGNAGEFVGSIAVSVILAISASLFFALTVIPALAAYLIRTNPGAHNGLADDGFSSRRLEQVYRWCLTWLLARPIRAIGFSLVLPITGFLLARTLPEQFFPPSDRDQFHIQLELPVDASITSTRNAAAKLDQLLSKIGADHISWYFGESAPMFYYNVINNRRGVPNFANAIVQLDSSVGMRQRLRQLQIQADRLVPEARVLVRQLEQGPPFEAPIEIRLFGPDLDRLEELGDEVRHLLSSATEVIHTKAQLNETLTTVSFDVRASDARLAGLGAKDVSRQLFALLEGVQAGTVLEDTEQVPVVVKVGEQDRNRVQAIHALTLEGQGGRQIPVQSVADLSFENEVAVIPRMNRRRMNLVSGFVTAGTLPSVSLVEFEQTLAATGFQLPPGYTMEYGGETSQRDDALGNLMANTGVLAVLMVASQVLSFGSFRYATIIFVVAFCSCGLGMVGLWCGGFPIGFMAIIGVMGLIGISINDSIVVLASLQNAAPQSAAGLKSVMPVNAIVEIVVRCTRHVLATTLTTIAGFMPLILDGGEFWPPLAVAIAGGVVGATLLALVFVPATFQIVQRQKVRYRQTRRVDDRDVPPEFTSVATS